jgi:MFS family permease
VDIPDTIAEVSVEKPKASMPLYTRLFFKLCASSFLFFLSFNLLLAELNRYITDLGGEDYKFLNIIMFAGAAMVARPISGRIADNVGRIPVMILGAGVCFIAGFLYSWTEGLMAYMFLRFFHGFSSGFKPTGTTAYMADIVPSNRRGEAVGLLGMAGSLGIAAGPPLGSFLAVNFGDDVMFYASSVAAILSILVLLGMKETLPERKKLTRSTFYITPADVFDKSVIRPGIVMFLSVASFGMTSFMIPDLSDHLGIDNRGTFFSIYVGVSVLVRFVTGQMSDRYGREYMLKIGMISLFIGMIGIALSTTPAMLFASAVIFGLANGINSPTIFAWTIDLANDKFRARATSSLFISLEAGIIAGILLANLVYQNNPDNFMPAFMIGAGMSLAGLIFLLWKKS